MIDKSKIKISYEELADENIDKVITAQLGKSSKNVIENPILVKYSVYKRWIFLIIAIIIGLIIIWSIIEIFRSILQEEKHLNIAGLISPAIMTGNLQRLFSPNMEEII